MKYFLSAVALFAASWAASADSQSFTSLLQFSGTGNASGSDSDYLTLSGKTLYGTKADGGVNGDGIIFSLATNGTNFHNLVSLTGTGGTASGVTPVGTLALSGTTLYGMTSAGGVYGLGNIFTVGIDGTNYQNLVSLTGTSGSANGQNPVGGLTLSGTTLYGMTYAGGTGIGSIFSVGTNGTNYQNLVSLTGNSGTANGAYPEGGLIVSGTTLYSTTFEGGTLGYGNIFSVGTNGRDFRNLVSFTGTNGSALGAYPSRSNLMLSGTTLYGMTGSGGVHNQGTLFDVGIDGSHYQNLVSFTGVGGTARGADPIGALILSGTTLYGTTFTGGAYPGNTGNVFSVGTDGSHFADLYDFTGGTDGGLPTSGLTLSGGTLYGATEVGGNLTLNYNNGDGTVFAIALPSNKWGKSNGGSWNSAGNWTSGVVPNGNGLQVILGTALTISSTITLDANQTVGSLVFNCGSRAYALSAGSGGTLTLNNGSSAPSEIVVLAGTHSTTSPLEIAGGNMVVTESGSGRLTISGNIGDDNNAESLTLNGDGTGVLVLSGTNSYRGGTIVQAGELIVTSPAALSDGSNLTVGYSVAVFSAPAIGTAHIADAPTTVPEPSSPALLGLATAACSLVLLRRTR